VPLPGVDKVPDVSQNRRKRRRHRRPLYRRPLRVIPLAILAILLVAAGIVTYRTLAAFDTVQSLSTPPPEISGAALGGEDDLVIDTGPAQEAVRQQQERERQQPESGNDIALVDTETADQQSTDPAHARATEPAPARSSDPGTTTPSAFTGASGSQPAAPPQASDDSRAPFTQTPPSEPDAAQSTVAPPVDTGGTTILVMGVDAREGESIDVGVRPDALAVLHLDDAGSCRMLAIPRDSRATLPGYGSSKINHALAVGGIPYEIQVVEGYLGIEIDHYGLVDFAGITQIVDTVGGIDVDNPTAFAIDDQAFAAGTIQLDGNRALLYARYRGGADGDFGRIAKQQQVLRAVLNRVRDVDLVALVPRSFSLLTDHIRTDLGPTDIVDLGTDYLDTCTSASLETRTIPGDVALLHDDLMQMQLSFVVSDPAAIQDSVDWLLGT